MGAEVITRSVRRRGGAHGCALLATLCALPAPTTAQMAPSRSDAVIHMSAPADTMSFLRLEQVAGVSPERLSQARIGAVTSAALDTRGRVILVDGLAGRAAVFATADPRVTQLPPVLARPWAVATMPGDTILLLDVSARTLVFLTPELETARRTPLPPEFTPAAIHADGGAVLVVGGAGNSLPAALLLGSDGDVTRDFGDLLAAMGIEGPITAAATVREWVFAAGDGRRIAAIPRDGTDGRVCAREEARTAAERFQQRFGAQHRSLRLLPLGGDTLLHTIRDITGNRYIAEVFTTRCQVLSRRFIDFPLALVEKAGDRLLGVLSLQSPEVVVYAIRKGR